MSTADITHTSARSRLRLLHGQPDTVPADRQSPDRAPLRLISKDRASILVAASDPARRRSMLQELAQRLPQGTSFKEAAAAWEVLEQAPSSRMVMLAGELEGSSVESVMHLLGNRHPQLPVLALSA